MGRAIAAAALLAALGQAEGAARWPSGAVISTWIDSRNAPLGGEALVERAITTWTAAAGGRFTLRRAARDGAVVGVHFVAGDANYGETAPRIDRATRTIVAAEVLIAGNIAADAGDALAQRIVIYLTALHELGHALGLPHTDDFSDIMYSFRRPDDGQRYFGAYRLRLRSVDDIGSARATGLSEKDLAALRTLYGR